MWSTALRSVWDLISAAHDARPQLLSAPPSLCASWGLLLLLSLFVCVFSQQVWDGGGGGGVTVVCHGLWPQCLSCYFHNQDYIWLGLNLEAGG